MSRTGRRIADRRLRARVGRAGPRRDHLGLHRRGRRIHPLRRAARSLAHHVERERPCGVSSRAARSGRDRMTRASPAATRRGRATWRGRSAPRRRTVRSRSERGYPCSRFGRKCSPESGSATFTLRRTDGAWHTRHHPKVGSCPGPHGSLACSPRRPEHGQGSARMDIRHSIAASRHGTRSWVGSCPRR